MEQLQVVWSKERRESLNFVPANTLNMMPRMRKLDTYFWT